MHCTNRATLQLTLTTGEQVTVCRPHAAQYRRFEPATTPDSAVATRSDPQLPARPDERGFAPAPEDYVRRIRLGVVSPTAAAREYLAAAREHHTETDVNALARDWGRQAAPTAR